MKVKVNVYENANVNANMIVIIVNENGKWYIDGAKVNTIKMYLINGM